MCLIALTIVADGVQLMTSLLMNMPHMVQSVHTLIRTHSYMHSNTHLEEEKKHKILRQSYTTATLNSCLACEPTSAQFGNIQEHSPLTLQWPSRQVCFKRCHTFSKRDSRHSHISHTAKPYSNINAKAIKVEPITYKLAYNTTSISFLGKPSLTLTFLLWS